jgi:hypothetical protein
MSTISRQIIGEAEPDIRRMAMVGLAVTGAVPAVMSFFDGPKVKFDGRKILSTLHSHDLRRLAANGWVATHNTFPNLLNNILNWKWETHPEDLKTFSGLDALHAAFEKDLKPRSVRFDHERASLWLQTNKPDVYKKLIR